MIVLLLALAITPFERDQCAHFKDAIIDNVVAAEAGDELAQGVISLYEGACVGNETGYVCIDSPIPGQGLRCKEKDK